jgi:uncharacterized LabA/DUF88 family protein
LRCQVLEEIVYEDERCAIFIDGPSVYQACRLLDMEIDFASLRSMFAEAGRLVQARYYTALFDGHQFSALRPLVDWLSYNGFIVVTRTVKRPLDVADRHTPISDIGNGLAIDALELMPGLDHVFLFSGNGDFQRLVQALQKKAVRTTVVGTIAGSSSLMSDELRRQADLFLDLRALSPMAMRERSQRTELRHAG